MLELGDGRVVDLPLAASCFIKGVCLMSVAMIGLVSL